jgi:hypothetical protein
MSHSDRDTLKGLTVDCYIRKSDENVDKIIGRDDERDYLIDFLGWLDDATLGAVAENFGIAVTDGGVERRAPVDKS